MLARPRKFARSLALLKPPVLPSHYSTCVRERESALARSPAPALSIRPSGAVSPLCRPSLGSLCNAARRENGENCFLGRIASGGFAFCTRPCMKWGYAWGGELSFI